MSRSAIVMLVVGAILLGIAAFVVHRFWPMLALESTLTQAIVLGLAGYGALLSAVMIRRIADPALPMPILAWGVAGAWFLIELFGKSEEQRERERHEEYMHGPKPEESSSFGKQGTGMGWAVFLTIVGLGMYGTGLGLTYWHAKQRLEAPTVTKPAGTHK